MRISELTTANGLDVLCDITPYLGAIITDEQLTAELRRKANVNSDSSQAEVWAAALEKITRLLPVILKSHRNDVYGIVGAINGKTEEEIEAQSFLTTLSEIVDIVRDKEFRNFFASLRNTEQN